MSSLQITRRWAWKRPFVSIAVVAIAAVGLAACGADAGMETVISLPAIPEAEATPSPEPSVEAGAPSNTAVDVTASPEPSVEADSPEAPSADDPTPTSTPESTPAPVPVLSVGWRTDVEVGSDPGDLATDTVVKLADGSTASLSELADGRPLLLYFFATW